MMQSRRKLSPIMHHYEGVDILRRDDFRDWIGVDGSGLLWIDGYEIPGRPSWLANLILSIAHAAILSGYEALYAFCSLQAIEHTRQGPVELVQRFSGHLLRKYPQLRDICDPELLSPEILLAAKTDLGLSFKIFCELLKSIPLPVVYITIEGIDRLYSSGDDRSDYQAFLRFLSALGAPNAIPNKVIKTIVASVKPDADIDIVFGQRNVDLSSTVLVRVAPATARSRKQRSISAVKRRMRIPSDSHASAETHTQTYRILSEEDFVPEPDDMLTTADPLKSIARDDKWPSMGDDFDIFDDGFTSEGNRTEKDDVLGAGGPSFPLVAEVKDSEGRTVDRHPDKSNPVSKDSFDIFS